MICTWHEKEMGKSHLSCVKDMARILDELHRERSFQSLVFNYEAKSLGPIVFRIIYTQVRRIGLTILTH